MTSNLEQWPEIKAFAERMATKLTEHEHTKGRHGWLTDDPRTLLTRLRKEVDELEDAINLYTNPNATFKVNELLNRIADEAADVGNFAMFIADWYGGLDNVKPTT